MMETHGAIHGSELLALIFKNAFCAATPTFCFDPGGLLLFQFLHMVPYSKNLKKKRKKKKSVYKVRTGKARAFDFPNRNNFFLQVRGDFRAWKCCN